MGSVCPGVYTQSRLDRYALGGLVQQLGGEGVIASYLRLAFFEKATHPPQPPSGGQRFAAFGDYVDQHKTPLRSNAGFSPVQCPANVLPACPECRVVPGLTGPAPSGPFTEPSESCSGLVSHPDV